MITQQELKNLLDYNPDTGIFTWKLNKGRIKKDSIAGTMHVNGYTHIQLNWKIYKAHRLAWLYVYGEMPLFPLDHINNDRSDNSINNLRAATVTQNNHNSKLSKNNTSGIKGIYWHRGAKKWAANIEAFNKKHYLGLFEDKELAELVVQEARLKFHKEFCNYG